MYRWLRLTFWILGALLVLTGIASLGVRIFVSAEEVRRTAETEARRLLGREVFIGQVSPGLFKTGVSEIVIADRDGGTNKPLLRIEEAGILLNPIPLLYDHISILKIGARGVFARIRRDARGRFNFGDIIDRLNEGENPRRAAPGADRKRRAGLFPFPSVSSAEAAEGDAPGDGAPGEEKEFSWAIHELDLHDATGEVRLERGGRRAAFAASCSFTHINLESVRAGRPLDIFLDGGCQKPGRESFLRIKGDLNIDPERGRYATSLEAERIDLPTLAESLSLAPLYRATLRRLRGDVAGKIGLTYLPNDKVAWDIDLTSEDVAAQLRPGGAGKWLPLRTGEIGVQAEGAYRFGSVSLKLERFALITPSLEVRMPEPADWNVDGRSAARFEWKISHLEKTPLVRGILAAPLPGLRVAGSAGGSVRISGDREKKRPVSAQGPIEVNLSSVSHADYPRMKLSGSISGRINKDVIRIRAPRLVVSDAGRRNAPPDITIEGVSASFGHAALRRGEIRSPGVRVKSVQVRYHYDKTRTSNIGRLLSGPPKKKGAKSQKASGARSGKSPKAASGRFLPVIKIKRFDIDKMGVHFRDRPNEKEPPVVLRIPDARVKVRDFDTRMPRRLRKTRLEVKTRAGTPSILVDAALNPSRMPPDIKGEVSFSRLDLSRLSPYAPHIEGDFMSILLTQGTRITKGELNFRANGSLQDQRVNLKGRVRIVGLELEPVEKAPFADAAVEFIRSSILRPFKKSNKTFAFDINVTGRLDDPDFNPVETFVAPVFAGLFEQVGNLVGDVGKIVGGILGTVIKGVQKVVPGIGGDDAPPGGRRGSRGKR